MKRRRSAKAVQPAADQQPRSWLRRLLRAVLIMCVGCIALSLALVLAYRWLNPPISGVMLQRKLEAATAGQPTALHRRWCSLAQIGEQLPRAVIAAEDQRFMQHHGFDLVEIENALEDARRGEGLRGASTISQQVAKNVFLTTHRHWVRKGLELWFTVLIEMLWSKQRILEVHLNVAEWGPQLFGACAASQHYFGRLPTELSSLQAAQMAVALPSPLTRRPDRLEPYSAQRAQWIRGQMPNVLVPAEQ